MLKLQLFLVLFQLIHFQGKLLILFSKLLNNLILLMIWRGIYIFLGWILQMLRGTAILVLILIMMGTSLVPAYYVIIMVDLSSICAALN